MANRTEYNNCMRPFITGSKPKEERRQAFCIGAKICSHKAQTEEEALHLCSHATSKPTQEASPSKNDPCSSVISMRDWLEQPSEGGVCRPCLLPPVIQWYMDVLNTAGRNDLAAELEGAVDGGEVTVATKLDEVKERVSPDVKGRLKEFDCHAQLYKGE